MIVLDESWVMLKNPIFAEQIEEWLRVLRKKKAFVIFATQSLSDITNSKIATAIKDNCPVKIFLPNPNAKQAHNSDLYKSFGLNEREIDIIAAAIPKREYIYKSQLGFRIFDLALDHFSLAYVAASSKDDHKLLNEVIAQMKNDSTLYVGEDKRFNTNDFNWRWLNAKGLSEDALIFKEAVS